MANISSQSKRTIAGARWYFTRNERKRAEHREYVAISATNGATAGAFFDQMEKVHAHFGKDEYVPAYERLRTGGYAKDEHGHRIPRLDGTGMRIYEPRYVQYYSLTQGFGLDELDPDDPASWDRAQELGRALAEADEFKDHMALVVTEIGGNGKLHNHILIDAVNRRTGASLQSSKVTHHRLAKTHDRVLASQGFEQRADMLALAAEVEDRQRAGEKGWSYRTVAAQTMDKADAVIERQDLRHEEWARDAAMAAHKGEPLPVEPFSIGELKRRATEALSDPRATSWEALRTVAEEHHLVIERRGKNVSFGMMRQQADGTWAEPAKSDRRRGSTLGEEYTREAVEKTIGRAAEIASPEPASPDLSEHQRRMEQMLAEREARDADLKARDADIEAQKAALEARSRKPVQKAARPEPTRPTTPTPRRFVGLSKEELAAEVDRLVMVRERRVSRQVFSIEDYEAGRHQEITRGVDYTRMEHVRGLTSAEATYLGGVWLDLGRPATADEEGRAPVGQRPLDAPEPELEPMPRRRRKSAPEEQQKAEEKPAVALEKSAPALPELRPLEPPIPPLDRERLDGVLELQESYREMPSDKDFEQTLIRLGDGNGAWLNRRFLNSYGDRLEPWMRDRLSARCDRVAEIQTAYTDHRSLAPQLEAATERYEGLVARGETGADLQQADAERQEISRRMTRDVGRIRARRARVEAGDYSTIEPLLQREDALQAKLDVLREHVGSWNPQARAMGPRIAQWTQNLDDAQRHVHRVPETGERTGERLDAHLDQLDKRVGSPYSRRHDRTAPARAQRTPEQELREQLYEQAQEASRRDSGDRPLA